MASHEDNMLSETIVGTLGHQEPLQDNPPSTELLTGSKREGLGYIRQGHVKEAPSLLLGDAESSTSSSQTPKALGDLALEPHGQQSPSFRVCLSGGSAQAPKLRVLEDAASARHKRSHIEMSIDVTSTYLPTKVSKMDTTIKKIGKRVIQHEQETQRRLDPQHGM